MISGNEDASTVGNEEGSGDNHSLVAEDEYTSCSEKVCGDGKASGDEKLNMDEMVSDDKYEDVSKEACVDEVTSDDEDISSTVSDGEASDDEVAFIKEDKDISIGDEATTFVEPASVDDKSSVDETLFPVLCAERSKNREDCKGEEDVVVDEGGKGEDASRAEDTVGLAVATDITTLERVVASAVELVKVALRLRLEALAERCRRKLNELGTLDVTEARDEEAGKGSSPVEVSSCSEVGLEISCAVALELLGV